MRPEEIALRMRGVTGLQTVVASRIARQLSQMGCEPRSALRELGLNERQQTQFNQVDPGYLAATLRWLEEPAHRMLNYGAAGYPERGPDRRCAAVSADRGRSSGVAAPAARHGWQPAVQPLRRALGQLFRRGIGALRFHHHQRFGDRHRRHLPSRSAGGRGLHGSGVGQRAGQCLSTPAPQARGADCRAGWRGDFRSFGHRFTSGRPFSAP